MNTAIAAAVTACYSNKHSQRIFVQRVFKVEINTNMNIVQPKLVEHARGARESVRRIRVNKHTESLFNSEQEHLKHIDSSCCSLTFLALCRIQSKS